MAKKANSAYDGTSIQLKRTQLEPTASSVVAQAEKLKYGEPLYFDNGDDVYLAIGDAASTATNSLKVFRAFPRSKTPNTLFYDGRTTSNYIDLTSEDDTLLHLRLNAFTTLNSAGESIEKYPASESTAKAVQVKVNGDWYKVNLDGTIGDKLATDDTTTFPRAQYIAVNSMTTDVIPYISLALTNLQRGSAISTKNIKKSFGNITDVESGTNQIIIYVGHKLMTYDCYIKVFGG